MRHGDNFHPPNAYNARALRPVPSLNRRAGAVCAALVALATSLITAPSALAGVIAPEDNGGSPNADHIHTLYLIVFFMGLAVFLVVEGLLVYSLFKFRFRRGGPAPAQIRGNTPLEIGWTVGAAAILVVLTVITFIFLNPIKNPAASLPNGYVAEQQTSQSTQYVKSHVPKGDGALQFASASQPAPPGPASQHLNIHVNGQQYIWRFDYPGGQAGAPGQIFSYHDMYVPTNTTVTLEHHLIGRRPLVVDPVARRQGGRDPQLHEPHLVPDQQAGHLQRAVRGVLRREPRRHARAGDRRAAGRSSRAGWRSRPPTSRNQRRCLR